jgi:hypothetical protein
VLQVYFVELLVDAREAIFVFVERLLDVSKQALQDVEIEGHLEYLVQFTWLG